MKLKSNNTKTLQIQLVMLMYVVQPSVPFFKLKQVTAVHFLTRRLLFPPLPPETTTPLVGSPCLEPRADHVQVIWIRHLWLLCLQLRSGSQCLDQPISTNMSVHKTLLNNREKKHGLAMIGQPAKRKQKWAVLNHPFPKQYYSTAIMSGFEHWQNWDSSSPRIGKKVKKKIESIT